MALRLTPTRPRSSTGAADRPRLESKRADLTVRPFCLWPRYFLLGAAAPGAVVDLNVQVGSNLQHFVSRLPKRPGVISCRWALSLLVTSTAKAAYGFTSRAIPLTKSHGSFRLSCSFPTIRPGGLRNLSGWHARMTPPSRPSRISWKKRGPHDRIKQKAGPLDRPFSLWLMDRSVCQGFCEAI
jgi:hypothetical protein